MRLRPAASARDRKARSNAPRLARRARVPLAAAAVLALGALALAFDLGSSGADVDPPATRTLGRHGAKAAAGTPKRSPSPTGSAASQPPIDAIVRLDPTRPGAPVPARFLGLSFEASALGQIAAYGLRGDLVTLLRSLGPGVIRFGGVSADTRVAWADAASPRPAWAQEALAAAQLRGLRLLAERSGWTVLLTIGLAHYDPAAAAREAAAARTALGPWLAAIEIGNEPDAYAHHRLRREPWTSARYNAEVARYRAAIARVAPGIPLAGPGVSGSHAFVSWGRGEAVALRPLILTGHHYPLACHAIPRPSIERLLSAPVRVEEDASLRRYMGVARSESLPLRIDETNTVSCGGRPGISNAFASALWGVSYIARTMAAGVVGVNLQGNPANCGGYSPLCARTLSSLTAGSLRAQPEWYSLLMTRYLIGARPLRVRTATSAPANLTVVAMRASDGGLRVVLVDADAPGSRAVSVSLRVGGTSRAASLLALTAPSLEATQGIALGGREVEANGSWREPARLPELPVTRGVANAVLEPGSAELVSVPAG